MRFWMIHAQDWLPGKIMGCLWGISSLNDSLEWLTTTCHLSGFGCEKLWLQIDGLMLKRRNSFAKALELRLVCIKPLKWSCLSLAYWWWYMTRRCVFCYMYSIYMERKHVRRDHEQGLDFYVSHWCFECKGDWTLVFNSLTPGKCGYNLKLIIFKLLSRINILKISCE